MKFIMNSKEINLRAEYIASEVKRQFDDLETNDRVVVAVICAMRNLQRYKLNAKDYDAFEQVFLGDLGYKTNLNQAGYEEVIKM